MIWTTCTSSGTLASTCSHTAPSWPGTCPLAPVPPRTGPPFNLEDEEDGGSDSGDRKVGGKKNKPRRYLTDAETNLECLSGSAVNSPLGLLPPPSPRTPKKECFSLKFDLNVDIDPEVVPAMKKKTLQEVLGPVFERKGIELSRVDLFVDQSNTPLSLNFEAYRLGGQYLKVKARPGEELKVEQGVKNLRSLSLPIMKPSSSQSPYILTPGSERVEHGSLGRHEAADLLGQAARRTKNLPIFLGVDSIPYSDAGPQLPIVGTPSQENRKIRTTSRISVFFGSNQGTNTTGKEVDRVEQQLQNKLHSYTLLGLPKVPPQLIFHRDSWEEEGETNLSLEDSWQQLLDKPESLSRRQFHQQEAIWELLQTEATYIKKLRVITDLFYCCLLNLQENKFLLEVDPMRLFSNIQDIIRLHTALWAEVMLPAVEKARQARALLDPVHLEEGFRTIDVRFKPYIQYCMEEEACMEYVKSLLRDNAPFRMYVMWAETHKQCNRLKLTDMVVKPHQRLTKYPLLLKSVLKKTDDPAGREALSSMVASVEAFIISVDTQMQQWQEHKKLASISGRIESYEAVDGGGEEVEKILREYNCFDLMAPMKGTPPGETRQLHMEGPLRMKEGKDSRMDVHCFLFTDMLLITKPVKREKVKVIRQPLFIHNVVCKELKDTGSFLVIYLNEFGNAVAAYSFQANSTTQGRSWTDAICNVRKQLQKLHSEELRRKQRQVGGAAEEEEVEEESSNSTASSPSLRHKDHQAESQSDGSTETLSVAVMEDGGDSSSQEAIPNSSADEASLVGVDVCSSGSMTVESHRDGLQTDSLDVPGAADRSMSLDSAYGTLSPESLFRQLSLREKPGQGEEDAEEEEEDMEGEAEEEEGEEQVEGPDEEDPTRTGSQLSVTNSIKLRRCAPVQHHQRCLQNLAIKCHSEDNLLQRVQGGVEARCNASNVMRTRLANRRAGLIHSRSLSQLNKQDFPFQAKHADSADDLSARCDSSGALTDNSECADSQQVQGALTGSDGKITASFSLGESAGSEEPGVARRSPTQQHKKLTLAHLYRIRTTVMLNSTLSAS
ncbi:LOW QUALITY PROTEIN: pleckstrin homology domain-containing family G member 5 [Brienomyrus brachyistius]|uniref:LOW QUALITY PROTEIN: pleckstrin homology domain-containing family G member 5 n=1 Tax=Brienomyrus brachyistius TaxID=42636 RepID=UPI0020B44624|nr:LOW QUALITY PROTEIN: pleckstrin homology domain-containing family G member 5 [Brienomyrus brachyistius]